MTSGKIYEAIRAKHSGPGWTVIAEAPITTGWDRRAGYIDAYAVGMWAENRGFIAYEIKVTKQDFLRDVERFATKQKVALENSTQFYYAAPHGMLRPDEMPEGCGLLEVQNGRAITSKVAAVRPMTALDSRFVAAILRAGTQTREAESKHAWRYMDKDLTLDDLLDLARKEGHILNDQTIERRARDKAGGEGTLADQALRRVAEKLGVYGSCRYSGASVVAETVLTEVEKLNESIKHRRNYGSIGDDVETIQYAIARIQKRLKEEERK